MPELNFTLPHWAYWLGLLVFPLVAMWMAKRQGERIFKAERSLFLAYLFWLCGGFLGLHRFYCKNWWGLVFVAVFVGAMFGESHVVAERENVSRTRAEVQKVVPAFERKQKQFGAGLPIVTPEKLEAARSAADIATAELAQAHADLQFWERITRWIAGLSGVILLIDAFLIPKLVRRWNDNVQAMVKAGAGGGWDGQAGLVDEAEIMGVDPRYGVFAPYTRWMDRLNGFIGEYVAYWVIIAVFLYFYEVVGRYAFNSPTNWVHESMFLMFGMQYALIGAYGYRDDSHVRVDIVYSRLSVRGKAICDMLTSVFFFIFTIALLFTGWRFAMDAVQIREVSFTEWGIQYWPVKLMLPLGALLIILQGVVRLARDICIVLGKIEVPTAAQEI